MIVLIVFKYELKYHYLTEASASPSVIASSAPSLTLSLVEIAYMRPVKRSSVHPTGHNGYACKHTVDHNYSTP